MQTKARDRYIPNLMAWQDEARILKTLEQGNTEGARVHLALRHLDAAMSFRSDELEEAEALRKLILGQARPGRN